MPVRSRLFVIGGCEAGRRSDDTTNKLWASYEGTRWDQSLPPMTKGGYSQLPLPLAHPKS